MLILFVVEIIFYLFIHCQLSQQKKKAYQQKRKYFISASSYSLFSIHKNKGQILLTQYTTKQPQMNASQQLFEINKRINQIKRNLSLRSQKVHQWSVPYEKILKNTQRGQEQTQLCTKQILNLYKTKQERKFHLQRKVRQSRRKIQNFHNQLKELQELQQKKTKLYVKKENPPQQQLQNQNSYNKRNSSPPNQLKTMNKIFNSSNYLASAIFSKAMSQGNLKTQKSIRTLKDRVNPFLTLKPEVIVDIFQEAKHSGKQNVVNQALGMGLEFTPYSIVLNKERKDENVEPKSLLSCFSILLQGKKDDPLQKKIEEKPKMSHLQKILGTKVQGHKEIYCKEPDSNRQTVIARRQLRKSKSPNIFERRMKKLIGETNAIQDCEENYVEMLRKQEKGSK